MTASMSPRGAAALAALTLSLSACSSSPTPSPEPVLPVAPDAVTVSIAPRPATATPPIATQSSAPRRPTSQDPAPTTRPSAHAAPTWSETDSPDRVAALFARSCWELDARSGVDAAAAQRRAAGLATPNFAATLRSGPQNSGGAAWMQLATHRGWTVTHAQASTSPDAPDTATTKMRMVTVSITARSDAGWRSATLYPAQVFYVQLTRSGRGWRVADARSAPA